MPGLRRGDGRDAGGDLSDRLPAARIDIRPYACPVTWVKARIALGRLREAKLSRDTLERISYILGIWKALQILLPDPAAADAWIRKPNAAPLFSGKPALERERHYQAMQNFTHMTARHTLKFGVDGRYIPIGELQPSAPQGQFNFDGRFTSTDPLRLLANMPSIFKRQALDTIPLWRGNHVSVKQLAEDFARYIYLPRLKNSVVLLDAIRNGVNLLTWELDSFAFADTYDEDGGRY